MSGIITDATDALLDEIATEFDIELDDVFHEYAGILSDPETKAMKLNKFDTAQYAIHVLRGEYRQG